MVALSRNHSSRLREELRGARVALRVLLEDLGHRELKIFLGDVLPSFAERVHACFLAYSLHLGPAALSHLLGKRTQVDPSLERHLARVDSENRNSRLGAIGEPFENGSEKDSGRSRNNDREAIGQ